MSEAVLDRALELLGSNGEPGAFRSIRLGSGEPLLAKPLLRRLDERLRHLKAAGRPVPEVFLTTNGTLLDAKTRDWLVATGWNVKVSLDGPPAVHDRWRITPRGRSTYGKVAEAAADLAARMRDRFSVSAVLCRGADPAEVFSAIARLGVARIELVPVGHPDAAILPDEEDVGSYRRFVMDYAETYASDDTVPAELVRVVNAARRVMGYDVNRVVCGAGRSFLGVGPEGDLYPCFRFVGLPEFRLGDLVRGPAPEALEAFQREAGRSFERREDCRECWAAPICGGPCFAEAELLGPGGGRPFRLHCEYVKADAGAAVALVEGVRRRDPERLLSLLAGLVEI